MIQVYVSSLQKGLKKIDEVPKQFRKEVQTILDSETQE